MGYSMNKMGGKSPNQMIYDFLLGGGFVDPRTGVGMGGFKNPNPGNRPVQGFAQPIQPTQPMQPGFDGVGTAPGGPNVGRPSPLRSRGNLMGLNYRLYGR